MKTPDFLPEVYPIFFYLLLNDWTVSKNGAHLIPGRTNHWLQFHDFSGSLPGKVGRLSRTGQGRQRRVQ